MKDAYSQPRVEKPGCQHRLGCKCDVPYHLRESTLVEQDREMLRNASLSNLGSWDRLYLDKPK